MARNTPQVDLQARILEALRQQKQKVMTNREIRELLLPGSGTNYMKEVDQALQKLRKAGHIVATTKGWVLTERTPCTACKGTGLAKPQVKEPAAAELQVAAPVTSQAPVAKVWLAIHYNCDRTETIPLGVFQDREDADSVAWWFGAGTVVHELAVGSPTQDCLECLTGWQHYHQELGRTPSHPELAKAQGALLP